jgi:centrosomal protein CEP76
MRAQKSILSKLPYYSKLTVLQLSTSFDDTLSYLLTTALSSYQLEKVCNTALPKDEFQESINNHIPKGHTFRGFPIQFSHRIPTRMMLYFLKSKMGLNILECRGDHVRHAVRCKIYLYPENTCSVWVCIAASFVAN